MSGFDQFPPRAATTLTEADVVALLLEDQRRGYRVYRDDSNRNAVWIELSDVASLRVSYGNNKVQVQSHYLGNVQNFLDAKSLTDVRSAIDALAIQSIGQRWQSHQTTGRLSQDRPARNLATIAGLVGSDSIEAIFDPYLENRSLAAVIDILSFGSGRVADGVRVLTAARTTVGQTPRLTRSGFDAWLRELSVTGELRVMPNSEHRRFLLLASGRTLILGQSLNSLEKNEAVRLEPGDADRAFFDVTWASAVELPA